MKRKRVIYCDKVVHAVSESGEILSTDILNSETLECLALAVDDSPRKALIKEQVQLALWELDEDEREFIARYYYMGESHRQIAEASGRKVHSIESLHSRALKKLRRELFRFVSAEFGVEVSRSGERCVICASEHRGAIDTLIRERPSHTTWRPVMKKLAREYGIAVATPQVLIGHQKYH